MTLTGPQLYEQFCVYADRIEELGWTEERSKLDELLTLLEGRLGLQLAVPGQVTKVRIRDTKSGAGRRFSVQFRLPGKAPVGKRRYRYMWWGCNLRTLHDDPEAELLAASINLPMGAQDFVDLLEHRLRKEAPTLMVLPTKLVAIDGGKWDILKIVGLCEK